jgi:LPS-assembly lipoprotein
MSSHRRLAAVTVAFVALAALAGCQVRPLYSSAPSLGVTGPQAALPAIAVEQPGGRIEQVYRNALLFGLRGGGDGVEPRYRLIYRMTTREQAIAVERGTGTPNLYQVSGSVSFLLKDATSDESIFGASVTSIDSYTYSSQSFSNIRARRDAENRLATSLAGLTQARLAAYFATH